jgi:hypothetical protein
MTFKNEAQLKKFLIDKCAIAVANTERKVHEELAGNLNQFYTEFKPKEYIRTGALFNALNSTGVIKTKSGAIAEVYFDTPSYQHGWVPLQSGGQGYSYWDDEYILKVAMEGGSHGGYEDGTAIWTESMNKLGGKSGIKILLIQELKKQGL